MRDFNLALAEYCGSPGCTNPGEFDGMCEKHWPPRLPEKPPQGAPIFGAGDPRDLSRWAE